MSVNWRRDPFTDADESIRITSEAHSVPASSKFDVYLNEIPRQDNPSSVRVLTSGSGTEIVTNGDAQVYEGNPTTLYGSQTYGQTGRDGIGAHYRYRFLVGFSLTGSPNPISQCLLRVYMNVIGSSGYPNPRTIGVHALQGSWSEGAVNYSNAPSYNAVAAAQKIVTVAGYYDFDITSLYNSWKSGAVTNYGVILVDGNEAEFDSVRQFATLQDSTSARRPRLVISAPGDTYTEVPRTQEPAPSEFAVNYDRGILRFNEADASESLLIDYWGMGTPIRA